MPNRMWIEVAFVPRLQPLVALGANGLNIGGGSAGMGGADVAVARDTTTLDTDTPRLAQLHAVHLLVVRR